MDSAPNHEEDHAARNKAIIQWLREHIGIPNRNERLGLADMGSWVSVMTVAFFVSEYFISIYSEAVVSPYLVDIHSATSIQDFVRDELGVDQTRALLGGIVLYFIIRFLGKYINRGIRFFLDFMEDHFDGVVRTFGVLLAALVILSLFHLNSITRSGLTLTGLFLGFMYVTFAKKVSIKIRFALYPIIILFVFPAMIIPEARKANQQTSGYPIYMYTSAPAAEKVTACNIARLGEVLRVKTPDEELFLGLKTFLRFEQMPEELFAQAENLCKAKYPDIRTVSRKAVIRSK